MKKLLLLLLIASGLSGCGRDYEDIMDELTVLRCNFESMLLVEATEAGMNAMQLDIEALMAEMKYEISSLSGDERLEAIKVITKWGQKWESGDLCS